MLNTKYCNVENYNQRLAILISERPETTQEIIEAKSKRILKIIFEDNVITIEGNKVFYQEVQDHLRKISLIRPGRRLLKRIANCCKSSPLKIIRGLENKYSHITHTLHLSDKFTFILDTDWKVEVTGREKSLAHELIHAMHYVENKEECNERLSCNDSSALIDRNFDNLEEQMTISGLWKNENVVDLCENAFLQAWGYKFRIGHGGISLGHNSKSQLTLDHLIKVGALNSIIEYIFEYPNSIHKTCYLNWLTQDDKLLSKTLYPISLACASNSNDIVDFLLNRGARLDVNDDLGGPILAACSNNHFNLARKIILKAQENAIEIDLEFQLGRLLQNDQNEKYNTLIFKPEEYYDFIWNISEIIKKQSPEGKFISLFERFFYLPEHSDAQKILKRLLEIKGKEVLSSLNGHDQNVLMILTKHMSNLNRKSMKYRNLSKLFQSILNDSLYFYNLNDKDSSGETLLNMVIKLEDEKLLGILQDYWS